MDFLENRMSLTSIVQGKEIYLDEQTLGKIVDVPIVVVRIMTKQHPTIKYVIEASKVGGTITNAVKKVEK